MFHSTSHQAVIMAASVCATDLFRFTLSLIHFYLTGSLLSFNPRFIQIALPECRQQTDIQILTTSNSLTVHLYSFNFHQSI